MDDPPWPSDTHGIYGANAIGIRRHRNQGSYWMYHFRGADSGGTYSHWSQFNLDNERWIGYNSPNAPWGIGLYGNNYKAFTMLVPREQTGYPTDRLYLWRGNRNYNFASIEIGDDGYVPGGASWTIHENTPFEQGSGLHCAYAGETILSTGTAENNRSDHLYRWDFPTNPTDTGTWELASNAFQDPIELGPQLFSVHDHLCGRVSVTEHKPNTYWLFADKNRLVVVVKNYNGEIGYFYVGKFKSYASPVNAILLEDVDALSGTINVSNPEIFEVNQKYMISDTTGKNGTYIQSEIINYSKLVAPNELFTVISNDGTGQLAITRLQAPYKAGSKVGEDPSPIMVRAHSIEKAMTLDNISLVDSDGYSDPAWQSYRLVPTVEDSFANATDIEERSLGTFLYSIVLLNEGDTYVGKEVRGQLIDVYSCGTSIASETEVNVGSRVYIAFDISNSGETQRIVVGPK